GTFPTGDSSNSIGITFTVLPANSTVVLAWGGHIADHHVWPLGTSAASIPGSPFHTRLLGLDGSGGNQDRSLSSDAVTFPATITIIKHASPPSSTTAFSFTTERTGQTMGGLSPSSFSLTDSDPDTDPSQPFTGITSFSTSLISGAYTFTEGVTAGWVYPPAISCGTSPV